MPCVTGYGITRHTATPNLWTDCFQFGDWLALDGENPAMPTGKTDEDFIASIYYYYSAYIVSETAKLIGNTADEVKYAKLSQGIKTAIHDEYISKNGRLTIDTQTAYALALQFKLIPNEQTSRVVSDLVNRIGKDDNHLKTGFVGTPYTNQMLQIWLPQISNNYLCMKITHHGFMLLISVPLQFGNAGIL